MTDIEGVFDRVYKNAGTKFADNQGVESAKLFLEAMRLSFQIRDEDYDIAFKYTDTKSSGVLFELLSLWGANWGSTKEEMKESIKSFQRIYQQNLRDAETLWIPQLQKDYPGSDLYENYEPLFDNFNGDLAKEKKEFRVQCPVNV